MELLQHLAHVWVGLGDGVQRRLVQLEQLAAGGGGDEEARDSRPFAVAAEREAVRASDAGGHQGRRPALEEADERHRYPADVDEDAGRDLDAGDHDGHRERAEAHAVKEGATQTVGGSGAGEPLEGVRVEEQAQDEETDGLEDVVGVHPIRPPAPLPLGRGRSSRRNLPV